MKNKLKEPEKTENGLLTKLYREILFKTGLINKVKSDIVLYHSRGGTRATASILKDITDGSITWSSFMFQLFKIHNIRKLTLKLTIQLSDDKDDISEHILIVDPKKTALKDRVSKKSRIKND